MSSYGYKTARSKNDGFRVKNYDTILKNLDQFRKPIQAGNAKGKKKNQKFQEKLYNKGVLG